MSGLIAYYFFVFSVLILTEFLTLYPLHRGRPNYLEGPQETLMQIGLPDCHQGTHRGWIYLILRQIWAAAVGLWKMKILRLLRTCQWPRKLPKMSLNIAQVTQIWNFPSKQNIQEWKRNTDQGKQTSVHICDKNKETHNRLYKYFNLNCIKKTWKKSSKHDLIYIFWNILHSLKSNTYFES